MNGFNFAEIDRLEKAWPRIKVHYFGQKLQGKSDIRRHLRGVDVSIRDALGQHAPEDMLASNIIGFSAAMQHEMGQFERGRVFQQLGMVDHARGAFYQSAESGEADALVGSCESVDGDMRPYADYYKGLVFEAMEEEDAAITWFKNAAWHRKLDHRPHVKLVSKWYARHDLEEGRCYLEDGIRRNLLSDGMLRHIAKYLSLKGAPESAVRDFVEVCVRNGRQLA